MCSEQKIDLYTTIPCTFPLFKVGIFYWKVILRKRNFKFSPMKNLFRLFKAIETDHLINFLKNRHSFTIHIIDYILQTTFLAISAITITPYLRISPYSVQMLEYTDQKNSEYRHFLRSESYYIYYRKRTIERRFYHERNKWNK